MLFLFLSLHWLLLLCPEVSGEVLVRYVCPIRSWCVSKHLCPHMATIDHSNSDDTEYLCGRPGSSSGYVCCSTQDLLQASFSPTSQLWHFTSDNDDLPDIIEDTLVLPWKEPAAGRYERETDDLTDDEVFFVEPEQGKSKEDYLSEVLEALEGSGARIDVDEPVLLDSYSSEEPKDAQEQEAPEVLEGYICPKRTLCVPWTLCESDDVSNLEGQAEYICGRTADSMEYVCCSRPLRLTEEDEQKDDKPPAPPVQPISFENLIEAYNNVFTPPIPPTTTIATPADYLDRVLGLDQQRGRRRRDLSDLEQQGTVKLGELQPRTPLVISEVAADPALVEFFLNRRREQLAQREKDRVITFKPIGIDTTIRRQQPPVLEETEDVEFEVPQQRTPPRKPRIQSLAGEPSFDETTDSFSPAQHIEQSQRVDDTNQRVEDNVKFSVIKPLEAQILKSEDGDVNGRSSLGAFLDKLLTIKSPEDERMESEPSTESYSQSEENSDKPRHHTVPPPPYPLHLFRPQGAHFNKPGNQAPHRFFPSAGQHEANNNPTANHHHRPPTHRPNPPLSQHHNPSTYNPSYGAVIEDHVVPKVCGRGSRLGILGRITTQRSEEGSTYYGEYPWHVAVLSAKDLSYLCAGVLVAPHMALTVAHCLEKLPEHTRLVLRVGDWDLASDSELYPAYDVPIASYIIHPEYYSSTLLNDIALLVLETAVEGLKHVQPACLPRQHTEFDHQHCRVSGWGQARHVAGDQHDTRSYSWLLRQTRLTVVPPISCEKHLRGTRQLGPFYRLPRTGALCAAGRQGRDACFGDGGGALVCRRHGDPLDGPYYVAGLVSWGIGCGQDIPAVYTKVSDYYPWILQHLQRLPPLKRYGQNPTSSDSITQ